jgi:hypothetical protein
MTMNNANRSGPKVGPEGARLKMKSRPFIEPSTQRILSLWKDLYGISSGKAIDYAIAFASANVQFKMPIKAQPTTDNKE